MRQGIVIAWMIVSGAILALISGKAWALDRRLKRTRLSADDEIHNTVTKLAAGLRMSRLPSVYIADSIAQPLVWGWLRGAIYLPLQFKNTGSAEQRKAILTHELAHIARWDAAANLSQAIVQSLFFFHPLIWWANKNLRREREKCCDEIVITCLSLRPQLYCEAIVDMLSLKSTARHSSLGLAVIGSTKNIEERIKTMLTPNRVFSRRPSPSVVGTLLVFAACVLPTAFVLTTHAVTPVGTELATDSWKEGQVMDFRVVNARTGEPIPGVSLELQNMGPGIDFQDVKVNTTDDGGRSLIRLPDTRPTAVRVYPSKPGFVPLRVYWEGEPHPVMPKSITIPLEPGHAIGGTIHNEQGEPISGVAVTVHYWGPGKGKNPHVRANVCPDNFTCKGQATSDEKGRWQIDVMPPEVDETKLRIYLTHPDYISDHLRRAITPRPVTQLPSIKELYDETAVMTMRKGEAINGQVINEKGKPVLNARIYDSEYYSLEPEKTRATTDANGIFKISGIIPEALNPQGSGQWSRSDINLEALTLTIQAKGYAPELVEVSRASLPLRVQLKRGQIVHGRVIDETGNPIEGVGIWARRWRDRDNRLYLESKSDADGAFQLTDVPADEIEYDFSKQGYMHVDSFPMSPSPDEYSVTMKAPVRIRGSVVDAETGKPLEDFSLFRGIDYEDGRAPSWMTHDMKTIRGGRYKTSIEQEGFSYRLRVEAEGYMPGESRVFKAYDPDKGEFTCDFKLRKAAPLTGTVVGLDGKPLANAEVYLARQRINIDNRKVSSVEQMDRPPLLSDEAGRFEFPAEVEPFCIVVVHIKGIGMITEKQFADSQKITIRPWTDKNQQLQIIRRPAPQQSVNFPEQYP